MRFRAFAGPSDFEAMVACANASSATDQTGVFRKVEDVARDYAAFTSCVPERDVWIAEVGTEIAGYVRSWHWAQADGLQLYGQFAVMAPQWRRQGIGASLHAWLESRQRETAAEHRSAPRHAYRWVPGIRFLMDLKQAWQRLCPGATERAKTVSI